MQQSIKLLHYRNGMYHGQIKQNKRNGKGILITDDGQIIIGTWKHDKLYGNVLMFINHSQYCYGEFNRGELQGWAKFESSDKILISQFNKSRPINKQLLIDKNDMSFKITAPIQNLLFETVKQSTFQKKISLQQLCKSQLNVKHQHHINFTLTEYLTQLYNKDDPFETEILPNGYLIFKLNDESTVVGLGFVLNKNNQLVSYGSFVNNKLSGLGCKFQNALRYEGIFENGFLNGEGLKFVSGKYSFGTFQNGNLTSPIYLQERSLASQQKLRQVKRTTHITHLNYANIYIPSNIIRFKGTRQIIFELALNKQFSYQKPNLVSSPSKKLTNLASKLLINRQQPEIKSIVSTVSKVKVNRISDEDQSRVSEIGKSISNNNSSRRFKNLKET